MGSKMQDLTQRYYVAPCKLCNMHCRFGGGVKTNVNSLFYENLRLQYLKSSIVQVPTCQKSIDSFERKHFPETWALVKRETDRVVFPLPIYNPIILIQFLSFLPAVPPMFTGGDTTASTLQEESEENEEEEEEGSDEDEIRGRKTNDAVL